MTRLIDAEALRKQAKELLDLADKRVDDTPNISPYYRIYLEQANERARFVGLIDNAPTVEPPKQLVLRARDNAELEQLKEAWSKGTINFAPIAAYTERMPIKCPDCKYFNKEWITDNRRKDKGYWNCWCSQHEFWVGGEDGYCSLAERKEVANEVHSDF